MPLAHWLFVLAEQGRPGFSEVVLGAVAGVDLDVDEVDGPRSSQRAEIRRRRVAEFPDDGANSGDAVPAPGDLVLAWLGIESDDQTAGLGVALQGSGKVGRVACVDEQHAGSAEGPDRVDRHDGLVAVTAEADAPAAIDVEVPGVRGHDGDEAGLLECGPHRLVGAQVFRPVCRYLGFFPAGDADLFVECAQEVLAGLEAWESEQPYVGIARHYRDASRPGSAEPGLPGSRLVIARLG